VINAGDVVITENPTFLGALIAFNPYEPTYAAVRMDDDGMDMNHLEETLAAVPGDDYRNPVRPSPLRSAGQQ
jgi:2-aminoadipate transaminase